MINTNAQVWLWGPLYSHHLDYALSQLKTSQNHLAVDGGCQVLPQLPAALVADWWALGDGDSAPAHLLNEIYPRDKEHSDLSLALAHPRAQRPRLRCFGFCGGRPDHHLLALGSFLNNFQTRTSAAQALLDRNWLVLSPGAWRGQLPPTTVSVMSLWPNLLSLMGEWRWRVNERQVRPFDDLLLSNQSLGGPLELHSQHACLLWSEAPIETWWEPV